MAAGGPSKGHAALLLLHAVVSALRSGAVAVPDLLPDVASVESRNQPQPPIRVRQDSDFESRPANSLLNFTIQKIFDD